MGNGPGLQQIYASIVFVYIEDKELRLGMSLERLGKLMTNLTTRPTPKTSRKNGSVRQV